MGSLFNCKKDSSSSGIKGENFSQFYYQNSSSNTTHEDLTSPKEKIDLFMSLENADPAGYSVIVSLSDDDFKTSKVIGRTNEKEGTSFTFDSTITIDYYFEKKQKLKFQLKKKDSYSQEEIPLSTTVASIMGAREQKQKLVFKEKSFLIVKGATVKNNNLNLKMELLANTQGINNCAPFYILKRKVMIDSGNLKQTNTNVNTNTNMMTTETSNIQQDNSKWIALFKSELAKTKEMEYHKFKETSIPIHLLTHEADFSQAEVLIELHDNYNQKMLGSCIVTIEKLLTKHFSFVIKSDNNYADYLLKANCSIEKKYRFLDYLRGGLQISLIVGIDFTGSNGDPSRNDSLHYISNTYENSYEKAIKACASTVAFYDSDQLFPVFGYGGILPNSGSANHCFNVNFQNDPNVQFVDGIINAYRNCIRTVKLSGPTNFAPTIRKTIQICQMEKGNYIYQILMILTDGIITDMDDTIDELVNASFLPISVIIIGIGNNDFSNMDILDADTEPLISRNRVKAQRDLVQFVPFFRFQNNEKLLAEEVLEEIPFQVEEYFRLNKYPPRDPIVDSY